MVISWLHVAQCYSYLHFYLYGFLSTFDVTQTTQSFFKPLACVTSRTSSDIDDHVVCAEMFYGSPFDESRRQSFHNVLYPIPHLVYPIPTLTRFKKVPELKGGKGLATDVMHFVYSTEGLQGRHSQPDSVQVKE